MRTAVLFLLALFWFQASAQGSNPPFVVEQTYWIKPGKESQFIGLFEKNRIPGLKEKMKDGTVLWMRLAKPQFNASNDQWDLRVTIAWRDMDSAMEKKGVDKEQLGREAQRQAMEQQILDELILEKTDVPVREWTVAGG